MTGLTVGALTVFLFAVVLTRLMERFVDWLIPQPLNLRVARLLARFALRIARNDAERDEARDALANVMSPSEDARATSPLLAVFPVLVRCLVGVFHSREPAVSRVPAVSQMPAVGVAYKHTNSKGVTYYLNSKSVEPVHEPPQTIYYFSKDERSETACLLPGDHVVNENPRNGFLVLLPK